MQKLTINIEKDLETLTIRTLNTIVNSNSMYDLIGLDKTEVYGFYLTSPQLLEQNTYKFKLDVVTILDTVSYILLLKIKTKHNVKLNLIDSILYGSTFTSLLNKEETEIQELSFKIKNYEKFLIYTFYELPENVLYDFYTTQITNISKDNSKTPINHIKSVQNELNNHEKEWYFRNHKNIHIITREKEIYVRFIKSFDVFDGVNKLRSVNIPLKDNYWINPFKCKLLETKTTYYIITSKYYLEYNKDTNSVYFIDFRNLSVKEIFTLLVKRGFTNNNKENYARIANIFDLRRNLI